MSDMFRNAFRSRTESANRDNSEYNPLGQSLIGSEDQVDDDGVGVTYAGSSSGGGVGEARPPLRSRMDSWGQSMKQKFNNLMRGSSLSGANRASNWLGSQQNRSSDMGQRSTDSISHTEPVEDIRTPEEINASIKELIESARTSSELLNETTAGALRNPVDAVELADTINYLAQVCVKLQKDISRLLTMEETLTDETLMMEALEANDSLTRGLSSYTNLMGEMPSQQAQQPPVGEEEGPRGQALPDSWAPLGPANNSNEQRDVAPPQPASAVGVGDDDGWQHYDPAAFEAATPPPPPPPPAEPTAAAQPEEDEEAMIMRAIAESLKSEEERAAKIAASEQGEMDLLGMGSQPAAPQQTVAPPQQPALLDAPGLQIPPALLDGRGPDAAIPPPQAPLVDPFAASMAPVQSTPPPPPPPADVQPNLISSLDSLSVTDPIGSSSAMPPMHQPVGPSVLPPPESIPPIQPSSADALPPVQPSIVASLDDIAGVGVSGGHPQENAPMTGSSTTASKDFLGM
mmetsp:Transcript_3774/g.4247  ORF Transcript_3774/g.4247 Transcript_3774/m.4247 type:complete len:516 (+) Transcript_3774:110-1657(+)|eukprot:CAMPEP_0197844570 /NCGR_PEP_ID=MMETSP1438-20131217/1559_1 /TAXON_ID=1461541 /ORGANISM="Pterosperma sp., Strain CCMP1384" /LENGTH=515 /DNA_ID=CAMNT_0043455427 /DNA_START=108 /DNA_END=1655 /DNA_ORIENTATION=-